MCVHLVAYICTFLHRSVGSRPWLSCGQPSHTSHASSDVACGWYVVTGVVAKTTQQLFISSVATQMCILWTPIPSTWTLHLHIPQQRRPHLPQRHPDMWPINHPSLLLLLLGVTMQGLPLFCTPLCMPQSVVLVVVLVVAVVVAVVVSMVQVYLCHENHQGGKHC